MSRTNTSYRSPRPNRAVATRATDLINARRAAEILQLDLRDQFYVTLWSIVRCFDPTTASVSPLPDEYRFPLLSSGELRRLRRTAPAAAARYVERKSKRDSWARTVWLVAPAWGGRKGPRSDWRFSIGRCESWSDQLRGDAGV